MKNLDLKKLKMPDKPGVYFFMKGQGILYIGKATSLKSRVRSYFDKNLINTRGAAIVDMVFKADKIKWQETDSVLEALILEAELIKKNQPYYNVKEKDDKSFNYVCITKEEIPKVLVIRGRELKNYTNKSFFSGPRVAATRSTRPFEKEFIGSVFGPFTNGSQLKEAMKIVRRIFPFFDASSVKKQNKVFYEQVGLTPSDTLTYKNNLKNLVLFFEGKKKQILNNLKKEMMVLAKNKEFEKANVVKKQIFALQHINDIALLKEESATFGNTFSKVLGSPAGSTRLSQKHFQTPLRIEAYDIAHMSGANMVGVMTVIENGEPTKNEYKKFIIQSQKNANDTGALEEVLSRRFRHTQWGMPDLVVTDGGIAQKKVAEQVLKRYQFNIPVLSVVKDDKHKAKAILGEKDLAKKYKKEILLANFEAHRFAITFHKLRRAKNFIKK